MRVEKAGFADVDALTALRLEYLIEDNGSLAHSDAEIRRRGYARMLMNAMIADAKELNIDVIELKATEDGYDLYRSVGFEDDRSKYHLMKWKAQREA